MELKDLQEELLSLNVNEKTEEKNGLTYLSWSWAWAELLKKYPTATYEIVKFEDNGKLVPYMFDKETGYMVFTKLTIENITREMWLPVMDGANKAMLDHEYTYTVRDYKTGEVKEKTVAKANMFDINKTIMRCLTKNLAMFGLGLYIYSGEDLPEDNRTVSNEQIKELEKLVEDIPAMLNYYNVKKIEDMKYIDAEEVIKRKNETVKRKNS
jgi:hypothetical protein